VFSAKRPDRLWVPPSLLCNSTAGPDSGLKLSGREADHSSPVSIEARNEWSYTVHLCIYGMQRENFTLTSMADVFAVLGCYTALIGSWLPTFRDKISVFKGQALPSLGLDRCASKMFVKARANREHTIWWRPVLHEVKLFLILRRTKMASRKFCHCIHNSQSPCIYKITRRHESKRPQSWHRRENVKSKNWEPFCLKFVHRFQKIGRLKIEDQLPIYYHDIKAYFWGGISRSGLKNEMVYG
jgi:hypothetical protein